MPLDTLTMARFLVLPGAEELVDAFSAIPPGALRQSIIDHAKVIRATYAAAPAEMQMADPLLTASQSAPRAALEGPRGGRRPKSPEEQIVALRFKGKSNEEIIAETGVSRAELDATLKAAREGGAKFPRRKTGKAPGPKTFPLRVEDLSAQGRNQATTAAAKRGLTLEQYMAARVAFVEMRRANQPMDEIAKTTGVGEKDLWTWLYGARAAGLDLALRVDYDDAEFVPMGEPEAAPDAADDGAVLEDPGGPPQSITKLLDGQRVFPNLADLPLGARTQMRRAAASRGMTVDAYADLRESIVRRRMNGEAPSQIARSTGESRTKIKDALAKAKERGVVFPPLDEEALANA